VDDVDRCFQGVDKSDLAARSTLWTDRWFAMHSAGGGDNILATGILSSLGERVLL
jgi:hypothetical protein